MLTTLATPLIFFAIVEAFVRTEITFRSGVNLFLVCSLNLAVAFGIGLTILNVWQPGKMWHHKLAELSQQETPQEPSSIATAMTKQADANSLSLLKLADDYVPKSMLQAFIENKVLTVAVLAVLVGAAMRTLKHQSQKEELSALITFEQLMIACYQITLCMLEWLIELSPLAIFLAVASVVGMTGPEIFQSAGVFFVTVVTCLLLHSLVYYPLSAWLLGGKPPRQFLREGRTAILTGFSINSSLATAPLTLQALERMGVSEASSRLSACVGTNFNNDGITLYEAITALFIAQAAGLELGMANQITILLAALAGSMGIAGIPNSGLIILTLVLKAANLPEQTVQLALPIVYSIDFIHARLRSAVNVMGDMQVAILLDGLADKAPSTEHEPSSPHP
jgi:DAACS family dicarboxylate/amino acid:cation (Na+ or H+) symporter